MSDTVQDKAYFKDIYDKRPVHYDCTVGKIKLPWNDDVIDIDKYLIRNKDVELARYQVGRGNDCINVEFDIITNDRRKVSDITNYLKDHYQLLNMYYYLV